MDDEPQAVRDEQRSFLKTGSEQRPASQVKEKSRLLQELDPTSGTPTEIPQDGPGVPSAAEIANLTAKLTELESRLTNTLEIDWDQEYRNAQAGQALIDRHPDPKSLSKNRRRNMVKKAKAEYKLKVEEINRQKAAHRMHVSDLKRSIASLKVYLESQKVGGSNQAGQKSEVADGADDAMSSESKEKLEGIKRKKEELMRKKDALAMQMAKLQVEKQQAAQKEVSQKEAPQEGVTHQLGTEKLPSTSESSPSDYKTKTSPSPSHIRTEDLHIRWPKGRIDDDLTIDYTKSATSLRAQLIAMQHRLKQFYPRLDEIPISLHKSSQTKNIHLLKTWLKILVNRWQVKTGLQQGGVPISNEHKDHHEEKYKMLLHNSYKGLSDEATKEEAANRWSKAFGESKEAAVTASGLLQSQTEEVEVGRSGPAGPVSVVEEFLRKNPDGNQGSKSSLRDEPGTNDASLNKQNSLGESTQTSPKQAQNAPPAPVQESDNGFNLPEEDFDAFASMLSDDPEAVEPVLSSTEQAQDAEESQEDTTSTEAVDDTEDLQTEKVAARSQLLTPQDADAQDISIQEHNLLAVQLGWGDASDAHAARLYSATRPLPTTYKNQTYPHLEAYDPRASSGLKQFKDAGLLPVLDEGPEHDKGPEPKKISTPRHKSSNSGPRLRKIGSNSTAGFRFTYPANNAGDSRSYSTSSSTPPAAPPRAPSSPQPPQEPSLPHLTPTGSAHMVAITSKPSTSRTAIAVGTVYFSNATPLSLITSNSVKKGDVLAVSRIAGIMAAKKCPDIVPLCHPIMLTSVGVELHPFGAWESPGGESPGHESPEDASNTAAEQNDALGFGGVHIEATVSCTGATGVEMEALTAVMGTALSVVDMCKAVDRAQRIGGVRVVRKEGGRSGSWGEEGWRSWQDVES